MSSVPSSDQIQELALRSAKSRFPVSASRSKTQSSKMSSSGFADTGRDLRAVRREHRTAEEITRFARCCDDLARSIDDSHLRLRQRRNPRRHGKHDRAAVRADVAAAIEARGHRNGVGQIEQPARRFDRECRRRTHRRGHELALGPGVIELAAVGAPGRHAEAVADAHREPKLTGLAEWADPDLVLVVRGGVIRETLAIRRQARTEHAGAARARARRAPRRRPRASARACHRQPAKKNRSASRRPAVKPRSWPATPSKVRSCSGSPPPFAFARYSTSLPMARSSAM